MKDKIKSLQTIHLALCGGLVAAFFTIGKFSAESFKIENIESAEYFYLALPLLAVLVSNLIYKSLMRKIDAGLAIEEKLPAVQTATLIRWAIIEVAAFALLFGQTRLSFLSILLIVYLIFLRPSEERIDRDLKAIG